MAARLVLATRNPHKLREFGPLLRPYELVPLPGEVELPPETGETFAENAAVKARTAAEATGLPAVADDSGISAAALGAGKSLVEDGRQDPNLRMPSSERAGETLR